MKLPPNCLVKEVRNADAGHEVTTLLELKDQEQVTDLSGQRNIIDFWGTYPMAKTTLLIFEYLPSKLYHQICAEGFQFEERHAKLAIKQLVTALKFCIDQKGYCHRELILRNIWLRKWEPDAENIMDRMEIVISSFGSAKKCNKKPILRGQTAVTAYAAPETFRRPEYNYKCDLWSLGVITYVMLSGGKHPFDPDDYGSIGRGDYQFRPKAIWGERSVESQAFIKTLLQLNPSDRPDYSEVLEHPWLREPLSYNPGYIIDTRLMKVQVQKSIRMEQDAD